MKDIIERTILEMQGALARGEISSRELALEYIARIARYDRVEGGLRSVAELNPDVLFIADLLDQKREKGQVMGPLHGVPIMLKDNIDTGDKMATTAGSLALAHNFPEKDATVAKKLRDAGALILGKANLSEFAYFISSKAPAGYSSRGGQVLNPYAPGIETPGGSSSGSGAAVAARLCAAAIGSDTCGSIMSPTQRNGLAGIRPTKGLISCAGVVPISNTMDTVGPMARSVTDLALLLEVVAGQDDLDTTTHGTPESWRYMHALDGELKGRRIGINMTGYSDELVTDDERNAFDALLKLLEENGATLVRDVENLNFDMEYQPMLDVMECEFAQSLNKYLSTSRNSGPRTMAEILLYNQANPTLMLKYGQDRMMLCHNETTRAQLDLRYLNTLALREEEIRKMDCLFDDNRLDVILRISFSTLTPLLGFPSISIPIGQKSNLAPIGSCWIGRRFDEARMISVVSAVERILGLSLRPELEKHYV